MTLVEMTLAALVLLATPGPTNTLMALAGADRGLRGALRLIPAELAAYLAVTVPLALAGSTVMAELPGLRSGLTLAAGAWVAWLAVAMWRLPAPGPAQAGVTARRVFVTTLLNPKALVVGLVLLPGDDLGLRVTVLACAVAGVAAAWGALGARLPGQPGVLRRVAASWLGLLALGLVSGGLSA
jgi:threonine/homoserine/homoserine lactone efflux protein